MNFGATQNPCRSEKLTASTERPRLSQGCTRGQRGSRGLREAGGSPSPSVSRPGAPSAHTASASDQELRQPQQVTGSGRALLTHLSPAPFAPAPNDEVAALYLPPHTPSRNTSPLETIRAEGSGGMWGVVPRRHGVHRAAPAGGTEGGRPATTAEAQPRRALDGRGTVPLGTHPRRNPGPAHPGTAGRGARAGRAARSPGARQRQRGTPSPPPPRSPPPVPTVAAPGRAQPSGSSSSSGRVVGDADWPRPRARPCLALAAGREGAARARPAPPRRPRPGAAPSLNMAARPARALSRDGGAAPRPATPAERRTGRVPVCVCFSSPVCLPCSS